MVERRADLHIHTHYSDSTMSPEEVIAGAQEAGLVCVAITDHDTIDGYAQAQQAGAAVGIEVLVGVELSSEQARKDVHILGYGFRLQDSPLVDKLQQMQMARIERMKKMLARLHTLGIRDISLEDVCGQTFSNAVGRLHLANMLVARGHVANRDAAFKRYLGEGASAYFPKFFQTPVEVIQLIKASGGVAVLAHPMITQRDELIPEWVRAGLDGIEVYYPHCSAILTEHYLRTARKHGLLVTGGSDAHGAGKKNTYIGRAWVTYDHVDAMHQKLGARD